MVRHGGSTPPRERHQQVSSVGEAEGEGKGRGGGDKCGWW